MLPIQDSSFAINSVYAGMFAEVSNLTNSIITNPDLTGLSFARDSFRAGLVENSEKHKSISEGISMVQAVDYAVDTISDKVDRMKTLATRAASGDYKKKEIAAFQVEFDLLAKDINELAVATTPGGNNFLNKQDGAVSISVGDGLSIDVDTTVMTVTGLGIIDSVDLTNDPEAVLSGLETASTRIGSYAAHLESKADALTTSLEVVESQRDGLLAVQSVIEGIGDAMTLAGTMNNASSALSNLLVLAQANLNIDSLMELLIANE
jgi:flagellin-like hook-associated protein FlgL